jgi:hypothetical protein
VKTYYLVEKKIFNPAYPGLIEDVKIKVPTDRNSGMGLK